MKRVTIYGGVSLAIALVFAVGAGSAWLMQPKWRVLTQKDIDTAVLHTLQTKSLPSRTARAAEAIRESVVEISSFPPPEKTVDTGPSRQARRAPPTKTPKSLPPSPATPRDDLAKGEAPDSKDAPPSRHPPTAKTPPGKHPPAARTPPAAKDPPIARSEPDSQVKPGDKPEPSHIGSGVVVTETGTILTNYHVVAGGGRLEVTFHDGSTAEATILQAIPEKDIAIIQAKSIPDDLPAATLGSSRELAPGSEVVAVGFPFGIGPSVSAGVVSGLDREFVSPDKKQNLTKLIQFDAAANPGNSGGPLVNMNGEVVGIVTAILNPSQSGTFIGIGFAITIENAGGSLGSSPF